MLLSLIVSVNLVHFPLFSRNFTTIRILRIAVGETCAFLWNDQETFVQFHFFSKKNSIMVFLAKILDKTAKYYCLTIIDNFYVISFWYSSNIDSP